MSIVIWLYYFLFRLVPQNPNIPQKPFMYSFMSKLVLSTSPSSSYLRPAFTPPFHLPSLSSTTLPFSTWPLHLPFVSSLSPSPHFLFSLPLLSSPLSVIILLFVVRNMKKSLPYISELLSQFPDEIDSDIQVSDQFICVYDTLLLSYFLLEWLNKASLLDE